MNANGALNHTHTHTHCLRVFAGRGVARKELRRARRARRRARQKENQQPRVAPHIIRRRRRKYGANRARRRAYKG